VSATLTTVNGILKEIYEGNINKQLSEERVLMKRLERTADGVGSDAVGGKYVTFPVHTSRNAGISYRAENVQLAPAGRQGFKSAQESLKYGYGRVRLTGQLIDLAESNRQAFASAMDLEMDGLKTDLSKDENHIAWGHIDSSVASGIKAKLSATATSATQTVDSTQYLQEGMVVDVTNAGTPVTGGTATTVVSINSDTSVTFSGSVTGTSGNYVSRTGNYNQEPNGINKIVDSTGAVHGLDPATTPVWKSYEDSATTTLTELSMIKTMDEIRRAGGATPSVIFMSLGVRRAYWNLMTSLRRYNEPKNFAGGLTGLSFMYGAGGDLPVVEDPDAPLKHAFFLTEKQITIYRDADWKWQDRDGAVLKWVTDYDAWEGLMKQYWQIGTHQRNAHGKMTNITES
jgi:hypothetical protein